LTSTLALDIYTPFVEWNVQASDIGRSSEHNDLPITKRIMNDP